MRDPNKDRNLRGKKKVQGNMRDPNKDRNLREKKKVQGNMRDPNKDRNLREKKKIFTEELVGNLVDMILGDKSYPERDWNRRIALVKKVMKDLKDPQFVLEQLTSLIMKENKSFHDVRKAESALQQLQSFLKSKNIVPNQHCANEIRKCPPDSILLNQNGGQIKALQEAREELQSAGEELKQMGVILEQNNQSLREANAYAISANMKQKEVDSCIMDFLNEDSANLVQEHDGVEVEGEQGYLDLTGLSSWERQYIFNLYPEDVTAMNWDEGTSNEANVKLSHDGTYMVQDEGTSNEANVTLSHDETCMVQGYTVFNRNANALIDIFQKHPNIVENFRVAHSDLQSYFMNLLAEVFQKIRKSKQEILGVEDIKNMELMIQDMEYNGLQVTWLKEMLAEVCERLENQKKHRELLEVINSCKAIGKEANTIEKKAKQKLARLEKKRRFQ